MDEFSMDILRAIDPEPPAPRKVRQSPADHYTHAVMLERVAYLRKMAKHSDGSASETLKEYPQHFTMLLFRSRSGEAEVHENHADLFFVLDGRATLVTGGTVAGARIVGPGESRGDSIDGGARQELRAGDVAHVPAGVAHQMLLEADKTLSCFVLKVLENPSSVAAG
jgi:mannose-6-phosphate isomerase-like protein (cupin superfamily)